MGRKVTIVAYHYVRDLANSRYPEIKACTVADFKEQVAYISKYYAPISMEDLLAAISSKDMQLPSNAILLTFDDGYMDHFTNVFPVLNERGISGAFFPSGECVSEKKVMDVNKIHFVLASGAGKAEIINFIFCSINELRAEYNLIENNWYYEQFAKGDRFDDKDTIFIKRILQKGLPEGARSAIIGNLFKKYVTDDERAFSTELYMNIDQIRCLKRNGMYIGNHGYRHVWLDGMDEAQQAKEVRLSLGFRKEIGCDLRSWAVCYPYGGYNESLIRILKENGCQLGLVDSLMNQKIADIDKQPGFLLPRLDTNDLPKNADAEPNRWTKEISL